MGRWTYLGRLLGLSISITNVGPSSRGRTSIGKVQASVYIVVSRRNTDDWLIKAAKDVPATLCGFRMAGIQKDHL